RWARASSCRAATSGSSWARRGSARNSSAALMRARNRARIREVREQHMAEQLDPRAAGARRLAGKGCIGTGAGQGIGRATARRLGQEGGRIVVADRIEESAARTVDELRTHEAEAIKVIVDLASFAGAHELMAQARAAFGRIDVLVNNVGG